MSRSELISRIRATLEHASDDELAVIERVTTRLAAGRLQYGPLCLESDPRDMRAESAAELTDCLFYLAADEVARQRRSAP